MAYTNSSLVSYTKLSPNHSGQRTHSIDRITPHCVVGQCSVETLGNIFLPTSRQASCNYGIGVDGRVGMYVEEKNRSWCSSSSANDQRAEMCIRDRILGMHADSYWYAGGLDDWFLDCDTNLTADDLVDYFRSSVIANGGDTSGDVDGITEPGAVTLRASSGGYPSEGVLTTAAADCNLSGTGRVSVTSEYISGTTAVSLVETSTSDDLEEWSDWAAVPSDGKLASPNLSLIHISPPMRPPRWDRLPALWRMP